MTMHVPSQMALVELSPDECLRHLQALRICRLGFCVDGLPVILPVNYAYVDGVIAIRTAAGSKLECAARGGPVAVEIDGLDHLYHEGWSVLVTGSCRLVDEGAFLERLRSLPLDSWAPGERDHFIAVTVEQISGRRISGPR